MNTFWHSLKWFFCFFFLFFFRFAPVLFRTRYISLTISYQHVLLLLWDHWNYGENRQNFPLVYPYFKMKHEVHCVRLICVLHDCAITFVYFSVFVFRFKLAIWTKIVIIGDKKIIWRLQPGTKQRHWSFVKVHQTRTLGIRRMVSFLFCTFFILYTVEFSIPSRSME